MPMRPRAIRSPCHIIGYVGTCFHSLSSPCLSSTMARRHYPLVPKLGYLTRAIHAEANKWVKKKSPAFNTIVPISFRFRRATNCHETEIPYNEHLTFSHGKNEKASSN